MSGDPSIRWVDDPSDYPSAIRADAAAAEQPERCAQCGASLAGTGPLVAAWLETTNGDAVCSESCR